MDIITVYLQLQLVIFAKSSDHFNQIEEVLLKNGLSGKYTKILAHECHQTQMNSIYGVFILDQAHTKGLTL